jgi:hypothetical protein
MIEITACPVCGCKSLVEVYPATFSGNLAGRGAIFLTGRTKAVHGRIVRCTGCGFLFTPPQFRMEDYARIYQAVHAGAAGSPPQFRFDVLARRVRETESGGRFLDFGCGGGGFLNVMKGFDGIGFEVAPGGLTRAGKIVTGDIMSEDFSRYGLGPPASTSSSRGTYWNISLSQHSKSYDCELC